MMKSNLGKLLQSFSPTEKRAARKFLQSPFFNTREDVFILFELLSRGQYDKEALWAAVYPEKPCEDQQFRLLCSYLYKTLEKFIAVSNLLEKPLNIELDMMGNLRRRGLADAYQRHQRSLEKKLERQPHRDTQYYQRAYRLEWENYQIATVENPTETQPIEQLARLADIAYLSRRLRLICLARAQAGVYGARPDSSADLQVLQLVRQYDWQQIPALAIYMACLDMLRNPDNEACFRHFKGLLLQDDQAFQPDETRGLLLWALNYCIRRINQNDRRYFSEALELYKVGLEKAYILEDGLLSRFTYHNIVAVGLSSGDLAWVEQFIYQYRNTLERSYRDSSFSFNLARLEFARAQYDQVLQLLQRANYRDPLLNLGAKTLLLKTYYELDEQDLLYAHLAAMENYIRRKKVIGYHRNNYRKLLRYTEHLLKLNPYDKAAVGQLASTIRQEEHFTEKDWFLKHLEGK